mgnify:CR=1 FL=1
MISHDLHPPTRPLPSTEPLAPHIAAHYGEAAAVPESWWVRNLKNGLLLELGALTFGLAAAALRLRNRWIRQ